MGSASINKMEMDCMGIKYYKKWIEEAGRFQYEQRNHDVSDDSMEEITEAEYTVETEKQWAEYIASLPNEEISGAPSYDELLEKNTQLETENAALLFKLLTGEEFADV